MTNQTKEVDISKKSDDEVAVDYLGIQYRKTAIEGERKEYHSEISGRIKDRGAFYGKDNLSQKIETPSHEMLLEARTKVEVNQDTALGLFDEKGIDDFEVVSTIELKEGVDPSAIPEDLKLRMNEFFLIQTSRVISKEAVEQNRKAGKLTDDEANSCIDKNTIHALKVKGKI